MRYVQLADLEVSALALGTVMWSFDDPSEADVEAAFDSAIEAGITLFDTAYAFTRPGIANHNERLLAKMVRRHPEALVRLSTKGGHYREGDEFPIDGRPETIRRHCEESLAALGVDTIDVYLLHHVDPTVPVADSFGAIADLRTAGKIRHVGLYTTSLAILEEASRSVEISVLNGQYGPTELPAPDLITACAERGIVCYAGHAIRTLTGSRLPAAFGEIARERGIAVHHVLLGWYRAQPPTVIPIVETMDGELVPSLLGGLDVELTRDELDRIARAG